MFKKVLIANRGAIAVRIERTLKAMGITSVAVYTKADQDSLHVENADEKVYLGEGTAKETYLNIKKILQAALDTKAEAIHPGYGFLSENAEFARECEKCGIKFIGPTAEQITLFGLKHSAREIAFRAKVPLLPGTGLIHDLNAAVKEAEQIGYPVILKSTAGGGGIGMRICGSREELENAYEGVCHLAAANFGNDGVFLEKYITRARHVEVQIFGNALDEVAAVGERDCSVQRRNQKVVEESPAPNLPEQVRQNMFAAAKRLAKEASYQSAGTVEFLYDESAEEFYFLEVNTRLQVEHGITEEVMGIDLVEWMVRNASGELTGLDHLLHEGKGHSIEVRIYAEDCLNEFRPSAGKIDKVLFDDTARVETWIRDGLEVTSLYDPMLAKLIVHGGSRAEAVAKMIKVLSNSRVYGLTTNLSYLEELLKTEAYMKGELYTGMLKGFLPEERAIEVIDGGVQTTVQDYPGRIGYWAVGVPPCGPMDSLSFRIGNKLLGNREDTAGLEMTLRGGTYKFRTKISFCLTGADMGAKLDGQEIPMYEVITAKAGQVLKLKEAKQGMRTYLLAAGGFDMPKILGSSATFTLGNFGGHGGRALRVGDVLRLHNECTARNRKLPADMRPEITNEWTMGVIAGPHSTKEFLKPEYLDILTSTEYEVDFNSARTGIRLNGPVPLWAREDGGEAGLHPSNIHDNAYAIGALDLTGDQSILLGPDGPSLGGFVCPVATASAQLWKLGQLHPGDKVHFKLISLETAVRLRHLQEEQLRAAADGLGDFRTEIFPEEQERIDGEYPVIFQDTDREYPITIRFAGDEYILVEYGEMELNIVLRFRVHVLMQEIEKEKELPLLDLTPGIRSLQIHIDPTKTSIKNLYKIILDIDASLPDLKTVTVPSRIVKLPLSFDDPATRLAIDRYQQTVRPDAPWCPSNLEFIRRINGLYSIEDVRKIVYEADYLVLGLGDVYLGAPVATPMDPRHRLVTTKYNPARTWTPENAVGIGGAYLCVYGMEGPGGYQFVGRTIQMWNPLRTTKSFMENKPWLLNFFDRIRFYPVGADELLQLREDFLRGRFEAEIEETSFHLGEYLAFLDSIKDSAEAFKEHQQKSFQAERERWKQLGLAEFVSEHAENTLATEEIIPEGCEAVRGNVPGRVWKVLAEEGQAVKKGNALAILESMKMEFPLLAEDNGIVEKIYVKPSDKVISGQMIACIRPV